MNDKISVLIPMFNRELFIEQSLDSILNQTYKNLDIIVYDDGSTDKSVEIIKSFMKKDNRIRLIEGKVNKGVGYARNQLLENCTTKYACWLDSDDISHLKRIELQYSKLNNKNLLVFTDWVWLHLIKNSWQGNTRNSNSQAFATLMFPVDKDIKFDIDKKLGGEDWDWIKKMKEKYQETNVDKILYYVRFHNDRIGTWKRKIREDLGGKIGKEIIDKLSYKELIEYYKKNF